MAVNPATPSKRSHKPQVSLIARDLAALNEHGWFQVHGTAIDALVALHKFRLPDNAPASQVKAKEDAFDAISELARLAMPMQATNGDYQAMKDDSTELRESMAAGEAVQKTLGDGKRGAK